MIVVRSSRGWYVRIQDPVNYDPRDIFGDKPVIEITGAASGIDVYLTQIDGVPNAAKKIA